MLYADDVSFTFMTPEGHGLAGWITFSASEREGTTVAQAQILMRANEPLSEFGLARYLHRWEDLFRRHTLTALAARFGVDGQVGTEVVCVDRKRQWRTPAISGTTPRSAPGSSPAARRSAADEWSKRKVPSAPRTRLRPPHKAKHAARVAPRTGCPRAARNTARRDVGAAQCHGFFRADRLGQWNPRKPVDA